MMFADLLATLETRGALHASRVKDMKTSLRYLAHALGQPTLDECQVGAACQQESTWTQALDAHFATLEEEGKPQGRTIGAVTRRNTRNNPGPSFAWPRQAGCRPHPSAAIAREAPA